MARKTNNRIRTKHLILCEGRDAEEVLITYLNSAALSDIPSFSNDFQVMDFGGNSDLQTFLETLKNMEGFDKVESIAIIRDAERDASQAKNEITRALRNCDLSIPNSAHEWQGDSPKIGFLLFPTCDSNVQAGTLEDLCLSILSENRSSEIIDDIQRFMNETGEKYDRIYPHEFKTKLHTYFSITDAYVSLKIGEAAKAGAFNWESTKLLPLKNFLQEIV